MSNMDSKRAIRLCKETTDIDVVIDLTRHEDPTVRRTALREMCPCRVRCDIDDFYRRMFEMVDDPSPKVREQVLHDICDGSPSHLEMDVAEALEKFNRDPDSHIRRRAHKALTAYRKTGKWNVLWPRYDGRKALVSWTVFKLLPT